MKYRVFRTDEFSDWLENQQLKSKTQIEKRIMHIQHDGHFGTINDVEDGVFELKWKDGRRVVKQLYNFSRTREGRSTPFILMVYADLNEKKLFLTMLIKQRKYSKGRVYHGLQRAKRNRATFKGSS